MYVPKITESAVHVEDAPKAVSALVRDWLDNEYAEGHLPTKEQALHEHELTNARWNTLRQGFRYGRVKDKS
jgi:hypothetical protein